MKTLFLALLALGGTLPVCLSADAVVKITMRTLAMGAFSGITEARQEVIKNQAAWNKFIAVHHTNTKSSPQLPAVDFAREMVIAVTLGRKNSGGYGIEITGVEAAANRLKVTVKGTAPASGAMVIAALTAPFHFVAVPQSDLKPEFEEAPRATKAK